MPDVEWTIGGESKERIEYIPLTRANDGMNDDQKESVRLWNLMVRTLRENGLMKDKDED